MVIGYGLELGSHVSFGGRPINPDMVLSSSWDWDVAVAVAKLWPEANSVKMLLLILCCRFFQISYKSIIPAMNVKIVLLIRLICFISLCSTYTT